LSTAKYLSCASNRKLYSSFLLKKTESCVATELGMYSTKNLSWEE
jgi:hypothetical protein